MIVAMYLISNFYVNLATLPMLGARNDVSCDKVCKYLEGYQVYLVSGYNACERIRGQNMWCSYYGAVI